MWEDEAAASVCVARLLTHVHDMTHPWLTPMRDMTDFRFTHMRGMTRSWLTPMRDMTHSWLTHTCDITYSCASACASLGICAAACTCVHICVWGETEWAYLRKCACVSVCCNLCEFEEVGGGFVTKYRVCACVCVCVCVCASVRVHVCGCVHSHLEGKLQIPWSPRRGIRPGGYCHFYEGACIFVMHICVSMFLCMFIFVHFFVCLFCVSWERLCECVCVCAFLGVYVCLRVYAWGVHACRCACLRMWLCCIWESCTASLYSWLILHTCTRAHTHTHTWTLTHTLTRTNTHTQLGERNGEDCIHT